MLKRNYKNNRCVTCYAIISITFCFYFLYTWRNQFRNEIEIALFMKENEWIAIILSSLTAITIALQTIIENRRNAREKSSLEFQQRYKESQAIHDFKKILKHNFNNLSSLKIKEIMHKDEIELTDSEMDFVNAADYILNEWERAANAINHNVFDENILYKAHGTTVLKLYQHLYDYISTRQEENPRYFINYVLLVAKWQIRRGKEERNHDKNLIEIKENLNKLMISLYNFYR